MIFGALGHRRACDFEVSSTGRATIRGVSRAAQVAEGCGEYDIGEGGYLDCSRAG